MDKNHEGFSQVALTLINHYDCVFYVDIETGHYTNLVPMKIFKTLGVPFEGKDFFSDLRDGVKKCIHPDDIKAYREAVDDILSDNVEMLTPLKYRARKVDGTYVVLTTRGFILSDEKGNSDYFGGIIVPV